MPQPDETTPPGGPMPPSRDTPADYDSLALDRARQAVRALPESIGPYRVLERLGGGGMGTVYKARQTRPIKREVAVKVIKAGLDTADVLARFESERQALARMSHPHIARVFDGGMDDAGRPYFVMEYVQGTPITQFADDKKLTIPQRLELFIQVCEAVAHAHSKAILHRDIKPANVLAHLDGDKFVAKVIDFGIAKALTGDRLTDRTFNTHSGQAVGTYESMSPEQADGSPDIDTRTDVYSLGVLLYELLTGSKPFDAAKLARAAEHELRRIIREDQPPRPSTRLSGLGAAGTVIAAARREQLDALEKELRSELEWIPMMAMRKERDRRYASPLAMAEDVKNYLEHRPLKAGPESVTYRWRKALRRNRAAWLSAAAVVALVAGGTAAYVGAVRQGQRLAREEQHKTQNALTQVTEQRTLARQQRDEAARQRDLAERRQKESAAVVEFLNADVFAGVTPDRMPEPAIRERVVQSMLVPGVTSARERFKDQPLVLATVLQSIGGVYHALEQSGPAIDLTEEAVELRRRWLGPDADDTLDAQQQYGRIISVVGRGGEAEGLFAEVLARRRRVFGDDHPKTIEAMGHYAGKLRDRGETEAALRLTQESVVRAARAFGHDDPRTAWILNRQARYLKELGRGTEAAEASLQVLDVYRRVYGENNLQALDAMMDCATCLIRDPDRKDEALSLAERAVNGFDRLMGTQTNDTVRVRDVYGGMLRDSGRAGDAAAMFKAVIDRIRSNPRNSHFMLFAQLSGYGRSLSRAGRIGEAEAEFRAMLDQARRDFGDDHLNTSEYAGALVELLRETGRGEEAKAVDATYPARPDGKPLLRGLKDADYLGIVPVATGTRGAAEINEAFEQAARLAANGETAESLARYARALALCRPALPADDATVAVILLRIGALELDLARPDAADAHAREALTLLAGQAFVHPLNRSAAESNLGRSLVARGRFAEAVPLLNAALTVRKRLLGPDRPDTRRTDAALAAALAHVTPAAPATRPATPADAGNWVAAADAAARRGDHADALADYAKALPVYGTLALDAAAELKVKMSFSARVLGHVAESERYAREALADFQAAERPDPRAVARANSAVGRALIAQSKDADAEPFLRAVLKDRGAVLGPLHEDTRRTAGILADLLQRLNRGQEAEALRTAYRVEPQSTPSNR